MGLVTYVMSSIDQVACATAPSVGQALGLCPCSSSHGLKWSLMTASSKPASSAATASRTSERGSDCSHIRVYPNLVMPGSYPTPANEHVRRRWHDRRVTARNARLGYALIVTAAVLFGLNG